MPKGRILSGMRPTDRLHLGNYEGALKNWVALQDEFEMFTMIADWHALTTGYERSREMRKFVREVAIDYVSAGLSPEKCAIFVQSEVKEHAELALLFSMITPTPWLIRNPTLKEQARDLGLAEDESDLVKINFGLLGYPVLQAADILIYKANYVPVGEDQVPHVELSREIARRFNFLYGEVFPEPKAKLTKIARLPGLDSKKMSKSLGNIIYLSDDVEAIGQKIATMFTDPTRIRKSDPGDPKERGCPVYRYHELYNGSDSEQVEAECRNTALGCVACKKALSAKIVETLSPIRERRAQIESRPGYIEDILADGAIRARKTAQETMAEVKEHMGLW
ncbi:MAG: tryptophan--tRNA ligase [Candidatus Latescibacterota bacterium]